MANMSYCRFRNTKMDLADCLEALEYREELSKEEHTACKWMFNDIFDFFVREGVLDTDDEWFEEIEARFDSFIDDIPMEA